jgi:glycoside/pentoside/hexuronide:cation symporter, GPH family
MVAAETSEGQAPSRSRTVQPMPDRLPVWRLALLALPGVPMAVFQLPLGVFLPAFMTGELGLTLTAWAMIVLVARVFDMVIDPMIGILCDRLPSRWGRRRHWIVIGAPIVMMASALLFMPRFFIEHMTVTYAMVAMCILQVGQTVVGLNIYAWAAELSEDYNERSRIMGWLSIIRSLSFMVMGIPAIIEWIDPTATSGDKLFWLAMFTLAMLPLSVGVAVTFVAERPDRIVRKKTADRMDVLKSWIALAKNKVMRRLLAIEIVGLLPFSISTSINVFYVTFVLQAPGATASTLLGAFFGAFLATPVWMWLSKRVQKHKLLLVAYVGSAIVLFPTIFLSPGDLMVFAMIVFLSGAFNACPTFLMRSIIADVVDTDILETGEQRTGTFFALIEMTQKLIPTVAVTFIFPFLQFMGFDPASKTNNPEAINVLRYVYGLFPIFPLLLTAFLLWTFPFGKRQQEAVRAKIRMKHGAS